VKKWIITILAALALVALGASTNGWMPWLLSLLLRTKARLGGINNPFELGVKCLAWLGAAALIAAKLRKSNTSPDEIISPSDLGNADPPADAEFPNEGNQPPSGPQSFFPDLPAKSDQLDFMPYASALADLIGSDTTKTPLTLGILGSWGSGKTTLMQFIEEALKSGRDTPVLIRFHAWKYDKEDALWRSMLLSVLQALLSELPERSGVRQDTNTRHGLAAPRAEIERLQQSLYRDVDWQERGGLTIDWPQVLKGTAGGALKLTFSLVPGLNAAASIAEAVKSARGSVAEGKLAEDLADVASAFKRDVVQHRQEQLRYTEQFQSQFRRLVKTSFGKRRIVIFVDDLDRCLPEKAVDVLEAIKLFLDVEGCVFVLAVDSQVISRGIQVKYKDFRETLGPDMAVDGDLYLGKIIQLPFLLPPIETDDMRHYVESFNADWPDPRCRDIFAEGLAPNPRQVKRTINVFLLLWKLAESRKSKLGEAVTPLRLAKIVVLQTAHPFVFGELKQEPTQLQHLEAYCRSLSGGSVSGSSPERISPALKQQAARVQKLFDLAYDDEKARFAKLKDEELASFFTLTKRVPGGTPRPEGLASDSVVLPPSPPSTGGAVQSTPLPAGVSPIQGIPSTSGDVVRGDRTVIYQPTPFLGLSHQLPPPPADFTGRITELRELRAAIEKGGIHISGLQGQGGVGKTALALKLADELTPYFPDAQIYLDLKGISEKPLTAAEAMTHVLRTFHPEAKLPEKEEDLHAQYLTVLHDKRALLLMDNAKDAAQVRPLIPPAGCTMLVTSRYHFTLPGLYARNLDTLPPSDAKALLLAIAPRIGGEAEAIAKLCGYLPPALRLAATAIAERLDLSPEDYRQKLADEKSRLLLLGGEAGVEASIALSYNMLDAHMQRRWRMLAVFPDTFDVRAAAAVWEIEGDAAQETLSSLLQFSMLEWNDSTKRYRLHDLMRDFARERLTPAESDSASRGHARHYGTVLAALDDLYLKGGGSLMRALLGFDLEWENIQAGQAWAEAHAPEDQKAAKLCSDYADYGTNLLSLRQHPRELVRWLETALAAARQLEDRAAESRHLGSLGLAYTDMGDYRRAIEYSEQRLAARDVYDRRGTSVSLGNLGNAYHSLGDYTRAIEYHSNALAIDREIGDRRGEEQDLVGLGNAYAAVGDYARAIDQHEKALAIGRGIGDRRGEGIVLGNLGNAYAASGQHLRAFEHYEEALTLAREIGDRRSEGSVLLNMSLTLDKLGDRKKAVEHAEAALKIFEEIEDPRVPQVRKQLDIWKNG
jgi:tetratricopeptide (TPR) repeat protein/Cdc6-like AAA superfamily ATPase